MKITWIGHSCFVIEDQGYKLVLDPYEEGAVPGLGSCTQEANEVICSHDHFDHNAAHLVTLRSDAVCPWKTIQLDAWHDEVQGAKRGSNKITILDNGSVRVAHFGDLGCELTSKQKDALQDVDVALIPVGGFYTIDADQAAAICKEIRAKTVIPMHYSIPEKGIGFDEIKGVDLFTRHFDKVSVSDAATLDPDTWQDGGIVVLKAKAANA